jgi:signal transduction histidine kinase/CheY-like chemotaxis protein
LVGPIVGTTTQKAESLTRTGTAQTHQDELERLTVYAAFLAVLGAVFSVVAYVHQGSGTISQPYVITLLVGPAYLVGRHVNVRVGTFLVSLVSLALLFGVGWVQGRGASMMGWMSIPFLGHALVSFRADAGLMLALSAILSLWLEAQFSELTQYANGVISIIGFFAVLYAAVWLFMRARQGAILELQASVRELEEESEQRRLAEARAREAERRQTDFLAMMSHEIRTPLHGIVGLSQLLSEGDAGERTPAYLAALGGSSQVLLSLLNDVLDLAKLDSGELEISPRPTAIRALCTRILTGYQGAISTDKVKLHLEVDLAVPIGLMLDEARVTEILGNLIGNAAKFTDHGEIKVSVAWVDAHLELRVQDSGAGIPAPQLPKLFDRYSKGVDGRQRGSGLGLALVKELVDAMGGSIEVESFQGAGSLFIVRLPSEVVELDLAEQPKERMDGLHLLLVDDNSVNRFVGQSLFESRGAQVTLAESGPVALDLLNQGLSPDVIITDLHMPSMDGLALLERIRSSGLNHPVVAFSAAVGNERAAALEAGMAAFLPKPVDLNAACQTLRALAS